MGRWKGLIVTAVAAGTLLAVLALAPSASAKPDFRFDTLHARGETRSGADYRLFADRSSGRRLGNGSFISLVVRTGDREQGHGDRFLTAYLPASKRQIVRRQRINTRFGQRGSVGMRFKQRSRRVKRGQCGREIVRRGFLVGHLRFRGEAGYVRVLTHRLPAVFRSDVINGCGGLAGSSASKKNAVLLASCRRNGTLFAARQLDGGRTDFVGLGPFTLHRGVISTAFGISSGERKQFTYSADLSTGTVAPQPPFRGVGEYAEGDEFKREGRMRGDLRGSFPSTKRLRFAPASASMRRGNAIDCSNDLIAEPAVASARSGVLRALGVDWIR